MIESSIIRVADPEDICASSTRRAVDTVVLLSKLYGRERTVGKSKVENVATEIVARHEQCKLELAFAKFRYLFLDWPWHCREK